MSGAPRMSSKLAGYGWKTLGVGLVAGLLAWFLEDSDDVSSLFGVVYAFGVILGAALLLIAGVIWVIGAGVREGRGD